MRFLLDTDTCIEYLNGRSPGVLKALQSRPPTELAVCSIVKAELYYGALRSRDPQDALAKVERFLAPFVCLPFDNGCALVYGRIRARLAETGSLIGPNDLLIASIAIANGLTLVTHNVREFGRVEGLAYEDWQA